MSNFKGAILSMIIWMGITLGITVMLMWPSYVFNSKEIVIAVSMAQIGAIAGLLVYLSTQNS